MRAVDKNMIKTKELQELFDTCAREGREAVIPAGTYVCGTLFLRDNLTVRLEKGAMILGSRDFEDYSNDVNLFIDGVGGERGRALVYGEGVKNVRIYGEGVINGRGRAFPSYHPHFNERPFLLRLRECENVTVEGITLLDSACWNFHIMNCDHVTVRSITVRSRANGNNDGIDIDASRHCLIEDCTVDTGDDAICFKATVNRPCAHNTVRRCTLSSNWAAIKMGTESVGDFEDIEIKDLYIYDTNGCAIKIEPVDGANARNIRIENINFDNCTGPIFIANGDRLRRYNEHFREEGGEINGVTIRSLHGVCINDMGVGSGKPGDEHQAKVMSCIVVSGTKEKPVKNLTLADFDVQMAGACKEYAPREIPEMGKRYPEYHVFGTLPAWGVYTRHTVNMQEENINLTAREEDVRPMTYHED